MTDLAFDTINREIVLEAGDFVLSQDSSVQNGQILLWSKSAFCLNPTLGVGIGGLIGSDVSELNYEMNRWAIQAKGDGAISASFQINTEVGNDEPLEKIKTAIQY